MKPIYFIIVFFLISCGAPEKKPVPSKLIEKFKPFLHGIWVTEDYINEVVKTKSPVKASEKMTMISEFSVDTSALSGDSILILAGYGNHEGGEFCLYFKQGATPNSLVTNIEGFEDESSSYELGYIFDNDDTSLVLYNYDKNKRLLEKTKYIKASSNNLIADLGNGLQYIVNKQLVAGSYSISDSTGQELNVELTPDGKITGLPNFETYYVLTDFVADPENATDQICFEIQTDKQKCYRFQIIADTISLFEAAKDEKDSLFKPGPAVYKLIKEK